MKRGMITLSKIELSAMLPFILQNEENNLLITKINTAINDENDPVNLLMSEDEIEIILDSLPVGSEASSDANNVRNNMTKFRNTL